MDYITEMKKSQAILENKTEFSDFQPLLCESPLPPFPLNSLPPTVRGFVGDLSLFTQTPPEMAGTLVLAVLAGCLQKRYTIRVRGDWFEPLCVYALVIAAPAERKSAVYSQLLKPVYSFVKYHNENNAAEVLKSSSKARILDEKIHKAEKLCSSGKGDYDELESLLREKAEFVPKVPLKLTVDDITPEKIVDVAAEQNNALLLCSSEGDLLEYVANGRYDVSNLGVYLKGYDGETVQVDRIKRGSQTVEKMLLSMALCCQPSALSAFMADPKASGRGLCARISYAICKGKIGERLTDPAEISEQAKAEYSDLIGKLLHHTTGTGDCPSDYLKLSPEADDVRRNFQSKIESRLVEDLSDMQDWSGKAVGKMLRFAGIFHIIESIESGYPPVDVPIQAATVENACMIADFLINHAVAAYSQSGENETEKQALYVWKKISSINSISKGELVRKTQGKRGLNLDEVLSVLAARGYVRIDYSRTGAAGRPSETIIVNPDVYE